MKKLVPFLFLLSFLLNAKAQNTQTVRGEVVEATTELPVIGAAVMLKQMDELIASGITDVNGKYRLENVPFGKYSIEVSFIGFKTYIDNEILVQAGQQTIVNVKLNESSFELAEIDVQATEHRGEVNNEYAIVSSRTFSIPETERYAGSRGEPSRMAANYAGVLGNNDNSNDIVVRGNTPIGLLWRMDGVNIPNPNHFAAGGSTGGPVTILNNQTLANSDFMTGAFAAEYGNTIAGVFDLKTRNGNNEKFEYSAELGFLGVKARAEGPLNKERGSSFLAAYRYSTFALFEAINFDIGTDAVPRYQDLNVKVNLPMKDHSNLSIFAIGGSSAIDIEPSTYEDPFDDVFTDPTMDESFKTRMGVVGATYKKALRSGIFMQLTAYTSYEQSANTLTGLKWDTTGGEATVIDTKLRIDYDFQTVKSGGSAEFKQSLHPRHNLKYGVYIDLYQFNFIDSTLYLPDSIYRTRLDYKGNGALIQPYINWSWAVNEKLSLITGIHGQVWTVSNSTSIEPRLGLKYRIDKSRWMEAGFGNHSQIMPTYTYFTNQFDENGDGSMNNQNVDFMRSWHAVVGYNQMINPYLRLKVEAYYQWLYNIPIEEQSSSYSILNEGGDLERFFPEILTNDGSGDNYGLEMTIEKFFNNNYFVFFSGSLFSSTYIASDKDQYNTLFNSGFAFNALGAREFTWGMNHRNKLTAGAKVTYAGGRRYTPLDLDASRQYGYAIYDYSQRNYFQFDNYFRFDLSIKYRLNKANLGHELGLDLVNLFDVQNGFKEDYNPLTEEKYVVYQLGFLPLFYYRIDF
jgi:hypothetical protein